jgi:hypothetical protein
VFSILPGGVIKAAAGVLILARRFASLWTPLGKIFIGSNEKMLIKRMRLEQIALMQLQHYLVMVR